MDALTTLRQAQYKGSVKGVTINFYGVFLIEDLVFINYRRYSKILRRITPYF